jgi:hypothetical protein
MRRERLPAVRRILIVGALAGALLTGGGVLAQNPHSGGTTGQPNMSCQDFGQFPNLNVPGFNTSGFNDVATTLYAGSKGTLPNGNTQNPTAVSQYDVACFQAAQR